jgi:hypothetical protein
MNCLDQVNHLGSSKYKFISSSFLKEKLETNGFEFSKLIENKLKKNKEVRQGFQKHTLIFNTNLKTEQGHLQLLVTNSHEGSSSVQFRLGFYRLVCSNGLIVGSNIIPIIRVNHNEKGFNELDKVIEQVVANFQKVKNSIEVMQKVQLTDSQINEFYGNVIKLRIPDKKVENFNIEVKRKEDNVKDLFTVFNVIQENLLTTGFRATIDGKERKIRAIKGHLQSIEINQQLWDMASTMVA